MQVTPQALKALQTPKGGWTRETLKMLGVPWPPPKGWKKRLLKGSKVNGKRKKKHVQKQARPRSKFKEFYQSDDWKRKRYEILKRDGGRCLCCGVSAKEGSILNVDHIKSLSTHWDLRLVDENLQTLCGSCNQGKGWKDSTDWRDEPREPSLAVLMGERIGTD